MGDINQEKTVPDAIKKWNWGAFLLSFFWSIRHGVWIGLLTLVPVVGWLMSLILAAKGNEWAWRKRDYTSVEEFLNTQKLWTKWGLIIWGSVFVFFGLTIGGIFYKMDTSSSTKQVIKIINNNEKISQYLGAPVKKISFVQGSIERESGKSTKSHINFEVQGTKQKARVYAELREFNHELNNMWYVDKLYIKNENTIEEKVFIDALQEYSPEIENVVVLEDVFIALDRNKDGYYVFIRLHEANEFFQVAAYDGGQSHTCFVAEYSESDDFKNHYQAKNSCLNKAEALHLAKMYSTGIDEWKNLLEWKKMTKRDLFPNKKSKQDIIRD